MTKTADKDEQLELKKRARRRLVGAIVFVSVAAVVLPLVMDEEPPPVAGGIELHIPAQEKGYTAPPGALAAPGAGAPAAAEAAAAPAPAEPIAPPTPVLPAAASDTRPDIKEAKAALKPEAKSEPAAAKAPLPKSAPATPVAAPAGDAKRAQAILDGKADKAVGSKAGGGQYIVLIGAFANPGNVQLIQKKLGEMGIRVYTEPLDTPQGRKIRVRAGPFANHEAAEKAAARMKKIGVGGVVAAKS